MVHWIAIILGVVTLTSPVFAQSSGVVGEAANWREVTSAGLRIYSSIDGSKLIQIVCDEATTLDYSATGISLEIGGLLPANSQVRFVVDGETITIPSDNSGGISTDDCPECASKFAQLWSLLRQGSTLEVVASDGRRATFSLRGTARLMPPEPCPAGLSARQPGTESGFSGATLAGPDKYTDRAPVFVSDSRSMAFSRSKSLQ